MNYFLNVLGYFCDQGWRRIEICFIRVDIGSRDCALCSSRRPVCIESMEHDALHADMTTPSGILQQSVMSGPRIHIMVVKKSKAIEKTQRGVLANNYQRSKTCAYTVASVFPLRKSLSSRTTQTRILIHTQTVSRGQQGFLRSLFQSSEAPLPP